LEWAVNEEMRLDLVEFFHGARDARGPLSTGPKISSWMSGTSTASDSSIAGR
jgi:hypothetical protein